MRVTVYWRALPADAGRAARDAFLADALGKARFARLTSGPGGKPFVAPAQEDPHPPHMSLSHTRGLIVCAVADAPVGVDVEARQRAVPPALARRILSAAEAGRFSALPAARQGAFLLERWVAKEAHLKRTGEGIAGGMASLTVADDGGVETDGGICGAVRVFSLAEAFVAVAAETAAIEAAFREI